MANNKLIAILAVVIIVVAGCSAVFLLAGDDDGKEKRINTDEVAAVYGNANHDYAVDDLDVKFIQDIIDKKTVWDSKKNPFADANNDGKIDASDIELVKKIINNEKCTVYYHNYFGEAQPLSYPVDTSRIAVTYWQQAELAGILGLWDNVVLANKSVDGRGQLYDLSKVTFMGNSSGAALDSEQAQLILEKKVTLIIGSAYDSVRSYADPLESQGVQTIYLWHAGSYCLSTLLTYGVLLNLEEKAEKFIGFWADIDEKISSKISDDKRPSVVIVMNHKDEDSYIKSYGGIFTSVNEPAGEWYLIGKLGKVYTTEVTGMKAQGRNFYSIDWFIENPFDYMVVMGSGTGANTQAEYDSWFETIAAKYYSNTQEYKNGNVLGTTFSFGGFSAYALMPVLAWMMYPDIFSYEEALELRQFYYDEFVPEKPDCREIPSYYLGSEYKASYLKN
ncbi:MAG: ABC transporter substrate-binding protein [archaeon]|nr:ABC transporter substrate-binding protein [archaeon]